MPSLNIRKVGDGPIKVPKGAWHRFQTSYTNSQLLDPGEPGFALRALSLGLRPDKSDSAVTNCRNSACQGIVLDPVLTSERRSGYVLRTTP